MVRLKTIAALLLVVLWLPEASHELLEKAGLIHTADGEHHDDHDAADGLCVAATTHVQTPQPNLHDSFASLAQLELWLAASAVVDGSVLAATGPAPPGVAPPELPQTWHFICRTALLARAPSCLA